MITFCTLDGVYRMINPRNVITVALESNKSLTITDINGVVYYYERDKHVTQATLDLMYRKLYSYE